MKGLLVAVLLAVTTIGSGSDFRAWGHSEPSSQFVSATELIGRPEFFNGQPVSAVGVAQFRDGARPVFRLYASTEDMRTSTPAAIGIGSFSKSLIISDKDLSFLNGRTVMIEGTFRMYDRGKLKPGEKPSSVCVSDCGVPGQITDIVGSQLGRQSEQHT